MSRRLRVGTTYLIAISAVCAGLALADEPDVFKTSPLAAAFGAAPLLWGPKLSPDGERLSQIQMHPMGFSVARVLDLSTGTLTGIVAGAIDSSADRDVTSCGWSNDTRLVCGLRVDRHDSAYRTRLFGVDRDGANLTLLGGYQVIDWLADDPDRVLVSPGYATNWQATRVNVYNGARTGVGPANQDISHWVADGDGELRMYRHVRTFGGDRWYLRDAPGSAWSALDEGQLTAGEDAFTPLGFSGRNELLFFDDHEGRRALLAFELDNSRSRRLVYAHDRLDVAAVQSFGRHKRFVAATYIDDRPAFHFLDERIARLHAEIENVFTERNVRIVDEDWNQRYYLIFVDGADDPGTYYRFDSERNVLLEILPLYPSLAGRELAPVRAVKYAADDGTLIPAYLTTPKGPPDLLPPAIVLPHDGPASLDYLRFDFFAQYLAAKGYVVLQMNYRGSAGYGDEWAGEDGYHDWRRVVGDIADGTEYLAREGLADAERICIAGWGYGGYAALMSVIEDPSLYRCVASIAGVTDPRRYLATYGPFGNPVERAFPHEDNAEFDAGRPLKRVDEIGVPVLLAHGERDNEVFLIESLSFARALNRAEKRWQLVRYEFAEHDILQDRYRTDLLARLGEFLDEHTAKK